MTVGNDIELKPDEFRMLSDFICELSGMVYEPSKTRTLERRLRPLVVANGCATFREYYYTLRYGDNGQAEEALNAVVNNETYFFREAAQIQGIVKLAATWQQDRPMRVLSAGCSTGEEPYSLAILLHDERAVSSISVEVVAVDVSTRVLEHATQGLYGPSSFRGSEGHYHDWHFTSENGSGLRLAPAIREMVALYHVNLLDRERLLSLGMFDAILCRNVLIYFKPAARRDVVESFREILHPGGHLFLGHSESLNRVSDDFELVRVSDALAYRKPGDVL